MGDLLGWDVRELTMGKVLRAKAEKNGDRPFLTYLPDGRVFSYRDVDLLSNRLANGLVACGLGHGSHVALLMNNSPEMLLTLFALGKIGAVAIPLNSAARGQLLTYFLNQSDSVALIVDEDLFERVVAVHADVPLVALVIVNRRGSDQRPGEAPTPLPARVVEFGELMRSTDAAVEIEVRYSDLALISYTSGTTGPSKGVMFTHAREHYGCLTNIRAYDYTGDDIFYVCLPIFHGNGRAGTLVALWLDAQVCLSERFSASRYWSDIRRSRATRTNLLGSMVNILWSQPPRDDDADNALLTCNFAPVPSFALEFEKRFGVRIASLYGLADYGNLTTFTPDDPVEKLGSAGRARIGWEIRVVDEDDFDVAPGTSGEIVCRVNAPWAASSGYYRMPEVTITSMRNGWFHTGDLGRLDSEGYLWFVDRMKDTIRRRGENISAFEIEQAIEAHPAVAEVAAFAARAAMSEDEVAAAIVLKPGRTVEAHEIVEHCARNLSYFMVPRYLRFVEDLPRNSLNKIEKFKLKEEANRDLSVYWDREQAGIVIKR